MRSILVVDDDPSTVAILSKALRVVGFDVHCARGGEEALFRLNNDAFDAVILDYTMPGLDGLQVLRRIRSNPHSADVPVVIYSAVDSDDVKDEAASAGVEEYWVKTRVDLKHMRDRLHDICEARSHSTDGLGHLPNQPESQ